MKDEGCCELLTLDRRSSILNEVAKNWGLTRRFSSDEWWESRGISGAGG